MQSKAITEEFTVAAQIGPEDVPAIKAQGFAAILCNRPDGEAADQPPYAAIEAAARAEGLAVAYAPVISGQITMEDVTAFREAVAALPGPIFAYCRSGARCQHLWMLAQGA
jgi:sulfide:quinone oxidoreductase